MSVCLSGSKFPSRALPMFVLLLCGLFLFLCDMSRSSDRTFLSSVCALMTAKGYHT